MAETVPAVLLDPALRWDNDPNALFPKCVHPTLSPEEKSNKKWLQPGSVAHNALCKVVLKDTLLCDK